MSVQATNPQADAVMPEFEPPLQRHQLSVDDYQPLEIYRQPSADGYRQILRPANDERIARLSRPTSGCLLLISGHKR